VRPRCNTSIHRQSPRRDGAEAAAARRQLGLAISEAAKVALTNDIDHELLTAVLNVHKAIEGERNALCHGHIGVCNAYPDGLLWMGTNDYIQFRASRTLSVHSHYGDAQHEELLKTIYIYRKSDLEAIYKDIKEQAWFWVELVRYLRFHQVRDRAPRAGLYRRLCDRPRIAQELERLRREKTPSSPP